MTGKNTTYKRKCNEDERAAFVEIYKYFEDFADLEKVNTDDEEEVSKYLIELLKAGHAIYNGRGKLRVSLVLAVQDYFSAVIKYRQGVR